MSTPEIKGAPASTPLQGSHHDGLSYAFRDTTRQPHIFSHSTESFPSVAPPEYERVHGSDGPGHFESSDLYHTQPPASHRTSRYRTGWGLEATGLLITISAFIGLLVVLTRVDGQRLSTWTFPLSVNTVVSILSIILKTPLAFMVGACIGQSKWSWFSKRSGTLSAFVAFDEASRGPLGCLTLLWRLKSCHWVSLGAWVTLALLSVDPFFQAVIGYEGQLDSIQTGDAEIARAPFLDFGDWYLERMIMMEYRGQTDVMKSFDIYPDVGVSATSLMGFINSSIATPDQPPSVSCKTGNCTWSQFSTVGICSRCADVSEYIVPEHKLGFPSENPFTSSHGSDATFVANYTSYVLPYYAGRRLLLEFVDGYIGNAPDSGGRIPRVDVVAVYRPNETYSFKDSGTLLASFGILSVDQAYWDNKTTWRDAKITATECALEFCGQVYQASSDGGTFEEKLVSTNFKRVESSYRPTSSDAESIRGGIEEDFGNSLGYDQQVSYSSTSDKKMVLAIERSPLEISLANDTGVAPDVQRTFNISQRSILGMSYFFTQNSTLDSIVYSLSDSTNLPTTFQAAARLLTNHFREINNDPARGATEQWLIYIRVTWMYFGFPVAILVAGLIFSLGTIYESHRLRLEKMKSDALAMLLHGLDSDTREILRAEKAEGSSIHDNVIVRLEQDKNGLNLRSGD